MISANDLKDTIARINQVLGQVGVKYHFTGGIASTYYGEPRFTQDLDIVIGLSPQIADAKNLIAALKTDYVIDAATITDSILHNRLFQALDKLTLIKLDFYSKEKIPHELSRSTQCELFSGVTVPLVSIEDAILSKLIWVQQGSDKARRDIEAMFTANSTIDLNYLNKTAEGLALSELLQEFMSPDHHKK